MEGVVALVLALLSIPFILPFVSFLMTRKLRGRVDDLEARIDQQNDQISRLSIQLNKLKEDGCNGVQRVQRVQRACNESVAARAAADQVRPKEPRRLQSKSRSR